jgi:hypothetical protein
MVKDTSGEDDARIQFSKHRYFEKDPTRSVAQENSDQQDQEAKGREPPH